MNVKDFPMFRPVLLASLLLVGGASSLFAAEPATGLATVPPVVAVEPKGELLDKVAAVVNDSIVTESEVTEQIAMITARLEEQKTPMPPADVIRRQVLDRLVIQEIQLQRAERLGMKVSDEQLNAAVGEIAKRNNLELAQLPDALRAQGIDYQSYRENVRKEITLTGLRQREVLGRINVTPRELDQFLERLKKLPSETSEYNISHILIAVPQDANQAQVDELERRANEVYERASGSEDFSRLAVAYSNSQTALEGGALGWRKGPELPTFLAELVVGLKSGEISKPMRTPSGFHLVKLNEMRSTEGDPVVATDTCAAYPHATQRAAGRCDGEAATRRHSRTHREGRGLRAAGIEPVGRLRLVRQRRRPGLEWPGQLRSRIRIRAFGPQGERNFRTVPHPVRLAHRPAARSAAVRYHRGQSAAARLPAAAREQGGRGNRNLDARMRDEPSSNTDV